MASRAAAVDAGTGYERKPPSYRAEITEVGRGTPMGELPRLHWHPVGLAQDAGSTPRPVRAPGEDLILFRDGDGNGDGEGEAGLVYSRCCHRGTTLYYGKVEDRGIRCCYHGWLFDREGHCLEMPCEPEMGARMRGRVRQPCGDGPMNVGFDPDQPPLRVRAGNWLGAMEAAA